MQLSEDQEKVVDLAQKWWLDFGKNKNPFVVTGMAGTGKSTILSEILEKLNIAPKRTMFLATSATATTNVHDKNRLAKANTIASFIKTHSEVIHIIKDDKEFETWYSITDITDSEVPDFDKEDAFEKIVGRDADIETVDLGLLQSIMNKLGYYAEREQVFDIVGDKPLDKNLDIVVVDELGMVTDAEMEAIIKKGLPVIATGDPYQLPPIGAEPNNYIKNKDYTWYSELTEIHRQSDDSGLIELASVARFGGDWRSKASELQNRHAKGIIVAPSARKQPKVLNFGDVILSPTNRNVQYFNQLIHEERFGKQNVLNINEKIVITSNTSQRNDAGLPTFSNGQIGVISKIYDEPEFDDIYAKLVDIRLDSRTFERVVINVKHIDDPRISSYRLKDQSAEDFALYRERRSMVFQRKLEDKYDTLVPEVVYVTYGYAMTVHRAQGKEWNNVIFDTDIPYVMLDNSTPLIYTAITRAKSKLLLM